MRKAFSQKPPAQEGAVHKIARPEKRSCGFRPPQNGRRGGADGMNVQTRTNVIESKLAVICNFYRMTWNIWLIASGVRVCRGSERSNENVSVKFGQKKPASCLTECVGGHTFKSTDMTFIGARTHSSRS